MLSSKVVSPKYLVMTSMFFKLSGLVHLAIDKVILPKFLVPKILKRPWNSKERGLVSLTSSSNVKVNLLFLVFSGS